jgi:hypothetical protein
VALQPVYACRPGQSGAGLQVTVMRVVVAEPGRIWISQANGATVEIGASEAVAGAGLDWRDGIGICWWGRDCLNESRI